jgi:hypothetical protein
MAERAPLTAKDLARLPEIRRKDLGEFAAILSADRGCVTPAEEFIRKLARYHREYPITPESLMDDVDEFRENFESAIENARKLVRQYPALILGENCGDWKDQVDALKEEHHDEQQQAFHLEDAREYVRRFPDLVMAEGMPEPWKGIMAKFEAERAAQRPSAAELQIVAGAGAVPRPTLTHPRSKHRADSSNRANPTPAAS